MSSSPDRKTVAPVEQHADVSESLLDIDPSDLEPLLLDGRAIAKHLNLHPGTLRNWASQGLLMRRGRDASGRTLYDYDETAALATRRHSPSEDDSGAQSITVTPDRLGTRVSEGKRCEVVAYHTHRECDAIVVPEAPFPICELHLRQAFLYVADRIRERRANRPPVNLRTPDERDAGRTVYYARRRSLYKIGCTLDVPRRMAELDVDELLATEPGGYQLETMRLKQFDHLRIAPGHEWLYPANDLLSHIEMVRKYNDGR